MQAVRSLHHKNGWMKRIFNVESERTGQKLEVRFKSNFADS